MGIGKSCRMFAKLDDGVIEKKIHGFFQNLHVQYLRNAKHLRNGEM